MSRRLLVALGLLVVSVAVAVGGPARAGAGPVLVESEERYGPDVRQVVTVTRPAGSYRDRRTAVFIHGGAWTGGSRATWDTEAREWASHGWVTINMDYRRAAFDGRPGDGPRIAKDVVAVYRKYAPLAVTGDVVFVGDSAGGQLATTVGAQFGRSNVAGVVAWSPVASPKAAAARARRSGVTTLQRELGRKAKEFWGLNYDGWSAHRPIRTGAAPPMYVVGGTFERYVDWDEQGNSLCTTKGFTGVCVALPTAEHGTAVWETPDGARQRVQARAWAESITR